MWEQVIIAVYLLVAVFLGWQAIRFKQLIDKIRQFYRAELEEAMEHRAFMEHFRDVVGREMEKRRAERGE